MPHPASLAVALACTAVVSAQQDTKSKDPPPGAPWMTNFLTADAATVKAGKPIFVYSTKTY